MGAGLDTMGPLVSLPARREVVGAAATTDDAPEAQLRLLALALPEAKQRSPPWPESHHWKPAADIDYEARRTLQSKSHRDIRRCLKRSISRRLYPIMESSAGTHATLTGGA